MFQVQADEAKVRGYLAQLEEMRSRLLEELANLEGQITGIRITLGEIEIKEEGQGQPGS